MTLKEKFYFIFLVIFFNTSILAEFKVLEPDNSCIRVPSFVKKFGFDPSISSLSTALRAKKGLYIITNSKEKIIKNETFQHPSWRQAGYLGSITRDKHGNVYVIPTPNVNLLDNPPSKANTIYKVDSITGIMKSWVELPLDNYDKNNSTFGLMGLSYSCKYDSIYATTVMGSTRKSEFGKIYRVSRETKEIQDSFSGFDGFGIQPGKFLGKDVLLLGHARSSNVFMISLNSMGNFIDRPKMIFSLKMLGPRGDDRAKKIKFVASSPFIFIEGYEFEYNLTAPSEDQKTAYRFTYLKDRETWARLNEKNQIIGILNN